MASAMFVASEAAADVDAGQILVRHEMRFSTVPLPSTARNG